ncbi:MgtC/SapB family protein [Archangium violaceum]|uniref:MgtC/SapB family protein n=1 Tax=Archangium violaceum TaxID=83451 RepID=UPI0019503EC1|nr:MgtC/SapB family protein [Archangium violaceum]QRN98733.1 MgtC/SapB family protein [Archangium violaceum]
MPDETTAVLRLCIAFGLGFVLGLERELRGQVAGLRTHILVCLGACLFTVCSILAAHPLETGMPQDVRADITRIASQVVVGIGFLGGGAILRHGATIKGLTTAANLWLTASVGLAVGFGYPVLAAVTTGLALVTLVGLRFLERIIRRFRKQFSLAPEDNLAALSPDGEGANMERKRD